MNLDFNDYEDLKKKDFLVLKYKCCYAQVLEPEVETYKREKVRS